MKKLALLLVVSFLFVASQLMAESENHLDKMDWEKQLSEAQKNNDYGSCQDVVIAAYLDKNLSVLNKAADICWPIGKNDPDLASAWANMVVTTKEEYIDMLGKSLGLTLEPNKQK
jgi:hypothetical protein